MTNLSTRFNAWMTEHDTGEVPATPAATVLVLRDSDDGPEILMVKRNSKGTFASNWVFPGGKIDPEDFDESGDIVTASRTAAAREAVEEADVVVDAESLIPFSHWMPPIVIPRRFATWFFATSAPEGIDGDVTIDGGEIVDHLWVTPGEALAKHAAGEVELVPPTWITLRHLADFATTTDALSWISDREPPFYLTKSFKADAPTVAWHGDAGYDSGDASVAGPRHRLVMDPDGWLFEEPN